MTRKMAIGFIALSFISFKVFAASDKYIGIQSNDAIPDFLNPSFVFQNGESNGDGCRVFINGIFKSNVTVFANKLLKQRYRFFFGKSANFKLDLPNSTFTFPGLSDSIQGGNVVSGISLFSILFENSDNYFFRGSKNASKDGCNQKSSDYIYDDSIAIICEKIKNLGHLLAAFCGFVIGILLWIVIKVS